MGEAGVERRVCKDKPGASFLQVGSQRPRGKEVLYREPRRPPLRHLPAALWPPLSLHSTGQALLTCGILHHLRSLESSMTVTFIVQLQAGGIHKKGRRLRGNGTKLTLHKINCFWVFFVYS